MEKRWRHLIAGGDGRAACPERFVGVGGVVGDPNEAPLLDARGLCKSYGEVRAVERVDLELHKGQVLALLGQNGAGKSTVGKMIAGLVRPDGGSVLVNGCDIGLLPWSERAGLVAIVQQELSIVPSVSVAENVFLGSPRHGSWRKSVLARDAVPYLMRVGLGDLDPRRAAADLSVAEAQLVEIARVLARDARVLVFDEPTAALSDIEIERVEAVVRGLVDDGRGVIYVTHRLAEVMRFCHTAVILRNGVSVAEIDTHLTPLAEIVTHMLGRALDSMFPAKAQYTGEVVFKVTGLEGPGLVSPVDLELRAGEITGFAGQAGAGATAALRLLTGIGRPTRGEMILDDRHVRFRSPASAVDAGIVSCSDDRKRDGLFPTRSVGENLTSLSLADLSVASWLAPAWQRVAAEQAARFVGVDSARLRSPVEHLSGGNQQKVVLGKVACRRPTPRVLVMNEPTRGVDVGARADIYRLMRRLADDGMAIAFASSDVTEVLGLADKVATFFRGRHVRTALASAVTERDLVLDVTHPRTES